MQRRRFLQSLAAGLGPLAFSRDLSAWTPGRSAARITSITLAQVDGRFHKFVAMNAYDTRPKGHTYTNTLVRIATDAGVEGVGVMEYAAPDAAFVEAVRALLGTDPAAAYVMQNGRMTGRAPALRTLLERYPHLDGPLFDLIGKLEGRPAWQLLGDAVRDSVELYDGTLYFADMWFRDRGTRAVVEEAEEAVRMGYPALKIKIGRGWRWMERADGLQRDIEVINEVRRAIGPDTRILVDANNGYDRDIEDAWRFLDGTQQSDVHFAEEMFTEDVAQYTRLRERIAAAGMKTLIADGENMRTPDQFRPYLSPERLVDVLQMDIRRGGFVSSLELAALADAAGAVSVPHNWGSQIGLFMALHFARAVPAATAAEDDRSTCDAVVADGYEFRNGHYTVSNAPGLGIHVDEATYARKYRAGEQVIASG
ncbi:MAG: enolase C-terminal domain-like protein [Gemmatimonadota bacterium]